jgi:hypothetical protein
MAVADDALATIPGLELAVPAEKVRDLRLDRLGKQATELWSKVGDGVDQEGGISWG